MSETRITVNAGICGFVTEIIASTEDEQMVRFTISSNCANIQGLATALPAEVDAYEEVGAGFDGEVWSTARQSLRGCCSGCVVTPAIFKAMQVAAGVALPADPTIHFVQEGT
ncbi:MAG: DUF6951 family protein [Armatimonadota bacterium]